MCREWGITNCALRVEAISWLVAQSDVYSVVQQENDIRMQTMTKHKIAIKLN